MPDIQTTEEFVNWLGYVAEVIEETDATTFTDGGAAEAVDRAIEALDGAKQALEDASRNGKVVTGEIPTVTEDGP